MFHPICSLLALPWPQVTIGGSGGVESVANVTDIHETLDFLSGERRLCMPARVCVWWHGAGWCL